MVGEDARAAKLADDIAQKRPYDTLVQFVETPLVKAQIELNHGNPGKAIDLLDSALVYARANSGVLYVRGNAYLKAGTRQRRSPGLSAPARHEERYHR